MYHPASDLSPCPRCVHAQGLCDREDCRRQVLPQLAKPSGLLRLMGEAHIEQTKRQEPEPKEKVQIARIGRRNARRVARTQRGPYALLKAIMKVK